MFYAKHKIYTDVKSGPKRKLEMNQKHHANKKNNVLIEFVA